MPRKFLFLGLCCVAFSVGCRNNDDIQTYRVSKEPSPPMPMGGAPMMGSGAAPMGGAGEPPMAGGGVGAPAGSDMQSMGATMGMQPAGSAKDIEWTVPKGWKEQPPSSMRVGSFLVKGSNGQQADVSVIPLLGNAGGDLANINRWRGQINLDPITEADLTQHSQILKSGNRTMRVVDFVSTELMIDNKYPRRLIAAICEQGNRTWFFKMLGEDKTVSEAKPAFLDFLKTLRLHG